MTLAKTNPKTKNMQYATYSPEDNKLRLYVGRVPREEYQKLKAEGWKALHKQREAGGGDFVAIWTPDRHDTAIAYSEDGIIYDEDMGPEERAADRAERFAGYRDKRTGEAIGHADRYESQPSAHGFQSEAKAERAAARHDRIGDRATDAWDKAEYWTRRTAGVIAHALYLSSPAVRMGRIKTLEAELRKVEAAKEGHTKHFRRVQKFAQDPEHVAKMAEMIAVRWYQGNIEDGIRSICEEISGLGEHRNPLNLEAPKAYYFEHQKGPNPPTVKDYAEYFLKTHHDPEIEGFQQTRCARWISHLKLRLAYEHQMLESQGGRAAMLEMEVGGWIGKHQIRKVNKSNATGRVVSVQVMGTTTGFTRESGYTKREARHCLVTLNIERLDVSEYTPPTEKDKAALLVTKKAEKAAAPKKAPCPLINPTDVDAERLQTALNEQAKADHCQRHLRAYGRDYAEQFKPSTVCRITQAVYSANAKGSYARAETRGLCRNAQLEPRTSNMYSSAAVAEAKRRGPKVCEIRTTGSDGSDYGARRVIVLTDKPQKPLPSAVWESYQAPQEAPEAVTA